MKIGFIGDNFYDTVMVKDGVASINEDYFNNYNYPFNERYDYTILNSHLVEKGLEDLDLLTIPTFYYETLNQYYNGKESYLGNDFNYDGIIYVAHKKTEEGLKDLLFQRANESSGKLYYVPDKLHIRDKVELSNYYLVRMEERKDVEDLVKKELYNYYFEFEKE